MIELEKNFCKGKKNFPFFTSVWIKNNSNILMVLMIFRGGFDRQV